MKHHMVTASGKRSAPKKHKIRHMMIEPMNNGFSVEHHFHPPESKDGSYMPPPDPEKYGFDSADSMAEHVGQMFGAKSSKGGKAPGKQPVRSGDNAKEEAAEEANENEG